MIDPKSKITEVSLALGKIFTSILNNQLYDYMLQKGILKAEQRGFRKMHGTVTVDSIFTLKMLIDNRSTEIYLFHASSTLEKPSTVHHDRN